MGLDTIPTDLLLLLCDQLNIYDKRSLSQINRRTFAFLNPILWKSVIFNAHTSSESMEDKTYFIDSPSFTFQDTSHFTEFRLPLQNIPTRTIRLYQSLRIPPSLTEAPSFSQIQHATFTNGFFKDAIDGTGTSVSLLARFLRQGLSGLRSVSLIIPNHDGFGRVRDENPHRRLVLTHPLLFYDLWAQAILEGFAARPHISFAIHASDFHFLYRLVSQPGGLQNITTITNTRLWKLRKINVGYGGRLNLGGYKFGPENRCDLVVPLVLNVSSTLHSLTLRTYNVEIPLARLCTPLLRYLKLYECFIDSCEPDTLDLSALQTLDLGRCILRQPEDFYSVLEFTAGKLQELALDTLSPRPMPLPVIPDDKCVVATPNLQEAKFCRFPSSSVPRFVDSALALCKLHLYRLTPELARRLRPAKLASLEMLKIDRISGVTNEDDSDNNEDEAAVIQAFAGLPALRHLRLSLWAPWITPDVTISNSEVLPPSGHGYWRLSAAFLAAVIKHPTAVLEVDYYEILNTVRSMSRMNDLSHFKQYVWRGPGLEAVDAAIMEGYTYTGYGKTSHVTKLTWNDVESLRDAGVV